MRVLITGGAGFVGSHLVDAHVARGDEVVVVDDLSTGRLDNIAAHVAAGRVRFLQGKAEDRAILEPAFEGVGRSARAGEKLWLARLRHDRRMQPRDRFFMRVFSEKAENHGL